jgi:hypothetical protein
VNRSARKTAIAVVAARHFDARTFIDDPKI